MLTKNCPSQEQRQESKLLSDCIWILWVIHQYPWLTRLLQMKLLKHQGGMGGRHCQMWFLTGQTMFILKIPFPCCLGPPEELSQNYLANRKCRHSLPCPSETELPNPAALSSLSPSHLLYLFLLIYGCSQQALYQFTRSLNCFFVCHRAILPLCDTGPEGTFPGEGCQCQAPLTICVKAAQPF